MTRGRPSVNDGLQRSTFGWALLVAVVNMLPTFRIP